MKDIQQTYPFIRVGQDPSVLIPYFTRSGEILRGKFRGVEPTDLGSSTSIWTLPVQVAHKQATSKILKRLKRGFLVMRDMIEEERIDRRKVIITMKTAA